MELNPAELQKYKVTSMKEAHKVLYKIKDRRKELLNEMRDKDNETIQKLTDERYELLKAEKQIGAQMTKIVKERLGNG